MKDKENTKQTIMRPIIKNGSNFMNFQTYQNRNTYQLTVGDGELLNEEDHLENSEDVKSQSNAHPTEDLSVLRA